MHKNPLFLFETPRDTTVTISISPTEKKRLQESVEDTLETLINHIDENLRMSGYIYNIYLDEEKETIHITPFEEKDVFNDEVFNVIAEELEHMDRFLEEN